MTISRVLNLIWIVGALTVVALGAVTFSGIGSWHEVYGGDGRLMALRRTDSGIELTVDCYGAQLRQTGDVPFIPGAVPWHLGGDETGPQFPGYWQCDQSGYSCRLHNHNLSEFILTEDRVTNEYTFANATKRSVTYDLQRLRPIYQELRTQCLGLDTSDLLAALSQNGVRAEVVGRPLRDYAIVRIVYPEGPEGMATALRVLADQPQVRRATAFTNARVAELIGQDGTTQADETFSAPRLIELELVP